MILLFKHNSAVPIPTPRTVRNNPQHQVEGFIDIAGKPKEGSGSTAQSFAGVEEERADQGAARRDTAEPDKERENVDDEKQQLQQLESEEGREEEDEDEKEDRGSSDDGSWGWGRDGRRFGPAWLAVATFVHEVWLLLQHANILLNPLCQRLDRSYGVALVRERSIISCLPCVLVARVVSRRSLWSRLLFGMPLK